MSLWGKLTGSDEAITAGVNGLVNGLDALVYTDEEKAVAAGTERAQARMMLIDWVKTTSGQNLARRLLAFMIAGTWLFMYLLSCVLDVLVVVTEACTGAVGSVCKATLYSQAGAVIGTRADNMTGAMMLILGFYFAAPYLGQIITPAMEKFAKKT